MSGGGRGGMDEDEDEEGQSLATSSWSFPSAFNRCEFSVFSWLSSHVSGCFQNEEAEGDRRFSP